MRKIKYKIWNKDKKEWHKFADAMSLDGNEVYFLGCDWERELDKFTVVQFVNVYDMHGNEVYEGDILEYKNIKYDDNWSIERKDQFNNKVLVYFTPQDHDNFPGFVIKQTYNQYGNFEIIGNIFENYDIIVDNPILKRYEKNISYLLD